MSSTATASGSYRITAEFEGEQYSFSCRGDQTVLEAAEDAGLDFPMSCGAGMCTVCAARVIEGSVDQSEAMGVKAELQEEGFTLLCVAFPRSDLQVRVGEEDALYEAQFGQVKK
ncbi:MAG: 2Fe-2S iron-sulfur cluster-binding protein [Prochlorococcus sp.]|nr:2Fe-2S iron-sulfur cluster-binding protein [Prochlorococcaceae cyanobacterium Fu_MAG_50]